MGQPGSNYDGEGMKGLARSTKNLADAFNSGWEYMKSVDSNAGCFGGLGEQTGVGRLFETKRDSLKTGMANAATVMEKLAEDVNTSFQEMDSRDAAAGQDIEKTRGEM